MTTSRTDALKTELDALVESKRPEIEGVTDLRRMELTFYFDERTGELFESEIKTVSRRRIARRVPTGRGKMAVAVSR